MDSPSLWSSTPRKSRIIFLLAVFMVFASFGFASDSISMGRQSILHFVISTLITGTFAVAYAANGIIMRGKWWKAFIPLFVLQFLLNGIVGHWMPDASELSEFNATQTASLSSRLIFDGCAILVSVALGYTGFVYSFISEGRRYLIAQTEKASLQSEMTAAREVQRIMVPEKLPPVSGYSIESVYHPAAEVGGDFFQVMPLNSGYTLVVIGDVSGKGLRAAMIVSMIVGMLNTLTGFTEEPAEILAGINRRLGGRIHDGFVTCLAVRLEEHGKITLANAGHLPPYINGVESISTGSLPLGIAESAEYSQVSLTMKLGDVAVLITDGIPEAQNKENSLLGFARIESLLSSAANVHILADTALQHGQTDDLTAISITRLA